MLCPNQHKSYTNIQRNVPEEAEPIEDLEPERYFFFFDLIFSFSRFFNSFSSFSLRSLSSFSLLSFSFFSSFSLSTFNFSFSFSSFSRSLSWKINYFILEVTLKTRYYLLPTIYLFIAAYSSLLQEITRKFNERKYRTSFISFSDLGHHN